MNPAKLAKAMFLPLTDIGVLIPLILFAVLTTIGMSGGIMGILLLVLLLPPIFRFQMLVLEATAKGTEPEPLDAENFSFAGSGWALFPLPLVIFITWAAVMAGARFGSGAELCVLLVAALIMPASLALLAITRSPLHSLNPVAIGRIWRTCGDTFWIASAYLLISSWICLQLGGLPLLVINFLQLVLTFSFFSLTGALIEPYGLVDDVYIPEALEKSDAEFRDDLENTRAAAMSHAYGFISRNNRAGGFGHIMDEIKQDPDPAGAWGWYFDHMMGWENKQHVMFFAQHHVADMLDHGEDIPALKAIMRCRLIDASFRPFPDDVVRAISAAERSGNIELAAVLKRG